MVFGLGKKGNKVVVTSVSLKWKGSAHALGRIDVRERTFDIKIPFQNKHQDDFNMDFLKTQKKPPIVVSRVDVKPPFKLVSLTPGLPASVDDSQRIEFKAKIEAPDYNYEGPMEVEFISDSSDTAHVEISNVVIKYKTKMVELKDKSKMMDMPKGLVFKQNIHLFGVVDFDNTVNKIEALPPFALVSSDPKVPFKIDRKTGYLVDLYIQAPQQNYGGPLEIKIS